jgi:hypothetical protein
MGVAGNLSVKLIADLAGWTTNLSKAERQLVGTAGKLDKLGTSLATRVTLPLIALGGVIAHAAAEDEASINKLARVFDKSTKDMEGYIQRLMRTVPETDDNLREMASGVKVLAGSLGVGARRSTEMSKEVLKLGGDLAAFKHTSVDEAVNTLSAALAGRTRGLVQYSLKIDDAAVKQEALRLGLVKHGQTLGTAAKAEATWSLILQKTTAQQGEAAKTIDEAANAPKRFTQSVDNLSDALGKALVPSMNKVLGKMTDFANKIAGLPENTQQWVVALGGIVAVMPLLLIGTGSLIRNFILLRNAIGGSTVLFSIAAAFRAASLAGTGLTGVLQGLIPLIGVGGFITIALGLLAGGIWAVKRSMDAGKKSASDYIAELAKLKPEQAKSELAATDAKIANLRAENKRLGANPEPIRFDREGLPLPSLTPRKQASNVQEINNLLAKRQVLRDMIPTEAGGDGGGGGGGGGGNTGGEDIFKDLNDRANNLTDNFDRGIKGWADELLRILGEVNGILRGEKNRLSPTATKANNLKDQLFGISTKGLDSAANDIGKNIAEKLATGEATRFQNTARGGRTDEEATKNLIAALEGTKESSMLQANAALQEIQDKTQSDQKVIASQSHMSQTLEQVGLQLTSLIAGALAGKLGGKAAGIGGGIGSIVGQGVLAANAGGLARFFGSKAIGGVIGSLIPGVGTIGGGLVGAGLGKLFGGLFGRHKKSVDKNAEALDKASKAADKLAESLTNIPQGFKIEGYRFRASNPNDPPGAGGSTGAPTPSPEPGGYGPDGIDRRDLPGSSIRANAMSNGAGNVFMIENLHVVANNAEELSTSLQRQADRLAARGGIQPTTTTFTITTVQAA